MPLLLACLLPCGACQHERLGHSVFSSLHTRANTGVYAFTRQLRARVDNAQSDAADPISKPAFGRLHVLLKGWFCSPIVSPFRKGEVLWCGTL